MNLWHKIKNWFKKGVDNLTVDSLTHVYDHPKISVNKDEYDRILSNLKYYKSDFDDINYLNSNGDNRTRKMFHLPIARTLSKKIASLVFNEQAEIIVDNESVNVFVNDILKNDRFNKNFERYLESCLALGGLGMRPYFDGKTIKVSFVQAPVFLPLENNGQDVSSACIITKTEKVEGKDRVYYTLFEFHEWEDDDYVITNELYYSKDKSLVGRRLDVQVIYNDLQPVTRIKGLSRPLFTYLKTPGMNNKDVNSALGLSIFDNAKTTIDFINRTYDEFAWEVKMGQRRVIVPEQTLKTTINRQGDTEIKRIEFDPDQNVYQPFGNPDIDNATSIIDLTTPIRSESYIQAINQGLSLFEMQVGVSAGMFTFDGKSMKTATEVVSENSDTYQMRNSIVSLVEHALKELVVSICELGQIYGIYSGDVPSLDDISVNLDDGVFTDRFKELEYWSKALSSGIISKQYAIEKVFKFPPETATDMLQQITNETVIAVNAVRTETDVDSYGE